MRRRVAITGLGVISALGGTAAETWDGLLAGRCGIGPVTLFDTSKDRTHTAAQITSFDPGRLLSLRDLRRASRGDQIGLAAALAAIEDAGLDLARLDRRRLGVLIGGGNGGLLQAEEYLRAALVGAPRAPSTALGFFASTTADRIASHLGCRGTVMTVQNACSSASLAIGLAASQVACGEDSIVLTGGVEILSRTTYAGFNALRLVDPERCRPFDRDRRGLSLGECAALMVLEDLESARSRGVRVYAEVAGHGMSADAHHMTAPDPQGEGIARAMAAALRSAGIDADQVDHINAHGTGTEQNDRAETRGIRRVLGGRAARIPVVSIKGMVGHCLGAAGAIEAFATALSIHHGMLPPTVGLEHPDPECDLDYVPGRARAVRVRVALSNSLAFGGNNGTLVLVRHEP
ncbi:MAG TPA: beta-ketoacyl-[acyl-carrier-protein] synthase family protein [Candidatus Polarisedimenticolia bacterium]|nr:beta-ketoacyl-[acyl-carrier-protein] synthase family protein [Candidatus Polarisedimenticolia bacterium]